MYVNMECPNVIDWWLILSGIFGVPCSSVMEYDLQPKKQPFLIYSSICFLGVRRFFEDPFGCIDAFQARCRRCLMHL